MNITIKLKDLMDELEGYSEESQSFLNIKTGEFVFVTLEDMRAAEDEEPFNHLYEWQQESRMIAIDVVDHFENYKELPTRYEINEYEMMENFCLTVSHQRKQDDLLRAIRGKGAFRRFKETIIEFDLVDQWYTYREECYRQVAIQWCEKNQINYIDSK